jgi:hypothetical protein
MGGDADALSVPRELLRIVRRHPHQLPERVVLFAVQRLAEPTRAWAAAVRARSGGDEAALSARGAALVRETTTASRVDGAVAGTPFLIALVPGYVAFLWAQARMVLRVAALRGRDPGDPALAAELLALRGIHPSVEDATAALRHLDEGAAPVRGWRERLAVWTLLARRILVLAALLSPASPERERRLRPRQVLLGALGMLIWIGTWIFPVTFMIVMAWSCERSTRELGALALDWYAAGDASTPSASRLTRLRARLARVRSPRRLAWAALLGLSVAVPLGMIALSVSTRASPAGWVRTLAPLAGLAVVLALSRALARRV